MNVKKDFPIFTAHPELVYLDSGATSLKPQPVIDAIVAYYSQYSANIHRGLYKISEKASAQYEETRSVVASFINAPSPNEIIFTSGTTAGINLVASTIGIDGIDEGDEVVTTVMEHHANFVPWQQLAFNTGADFKVIDINENHELGIMNEDGTIDLSGIITKRTKIFAITLVSNTLGTINPVKEIIAEAKKINPKVITVVDAAQAAPHVSIDVQDLGCDFLAFSAHKMLGPTGVGIVWGRSDALASMPPYQLGGDMISEVSLSKTTYAKVPHKFEAGTPNIAGVIGLKAAIKYLQAVGIDAIAKHEHALASYAIDQLQKEFGEEITILGPADRGQRAGIISFTVGKIHAHDIAQILDEHNIAVRAGHHCTMPLHTRLNISASTRASFYVYNTQEDVEKLVGGLKKVKKVFS
jgi:cysteine desulfurase/selenocysteine lyase